MNLKTVQDYGPKIAEAAGTEFSESTEIEVAVDITPTRLLQESSDAGSNNPANPVPSALLDDNRIKYRARPIRYKNSDANNARVKVVNEETFNCTAYCTGNQTSRICNAKVFKGNKCGYKTGNLTGKEKRRARMCIRYYPEAAKEERERRQKLRD